MVEADSAADCKRTIDWLDDESNADIADGRLSAIMPRYDTLYITDRVCRAAWVVLSSHGQQHADQCSIAKGQVCCMQTDGTLTSAVAWYCTFLVMACRKLFQDDAAVKSGLLQVFVRMKPLPAATATCMVLDHNNLLKATW